MSLNSQISGYFADKPTLTVEDLRVLPSHKLVKIVKDLEDELRHFQQENEIFLNFLQTQEPSMIAEMEVILEKARRLQDIREQSVVTFKPVSNLDLPRSRRTSETIEITKGPRINLTQKTDLALREIEDVQNSYEKFIKRAKQTKFRLRAEIEELEIRSKEVNQAFEAFEKNIVVDGVSKITQKIPAEIYVRYLQDWLKSADFVLEKLRLRTLSFKIQLRKLKAQKAQKEDLGESVDVADLEKMEIEKVHLINEIKQKNSNLVELKHMSSKAHMMLTNHKRILEKQKLTIQQVKEAVEISKSKVQVLFGDARIAENEVEHERKRYREIRKLYKKYEVPSVMEYIRKKDELREIQKEVKMWQRKEKLIENGLATYTKMMCTLRSTKDIDPQWYSLKLFEPDEPIGGRTSYNYEPLYSDSCVTLLSNF